MYVCRFVMMAEDVVVVVVVVVVMVVMVVMVVEQQVVVAQTRAPRTSRPRFCHEREQPKAQPTAAQRTESPPAWSRLSGPLQVPFQVPSSPTATPTVLCCTVPYRTVHADWRPQVAPQSAHYPNPVKHQPSASCRVSGAPSRSAARPPAMSVIVFLDSLQTAVVKAKLPALAVDSRKQSRRRRLLFTPSPLDPVRLLYRAHLAPYVTTRG
ncbi:hypothetical protein IWX47DRAFT_601062 [Phyllosticta citricarpa]|uniref:Secreted protein n=1 Tax=Phyllosticta citricarpa TaxID=55181 RepID=A0ABR1MCS6_9PEZI